MPRVRNTTDSFAPRQASIRFIAGTKVTDIPAHEYLEKIEVESAGEGGWHGTITLFDAQQEFLEELVLAAGASRKIQFQFGWDSGAPIHDLPLFDGAITGYKPKFRTDGIEMEISMTASSVLDSVLDKKPRSFKAGFTATEIFLKIAEEFGWKTKDRNGKDTYEKSETKLLEHSFNSVSAFKFVLDDLRKKATNASGQCFHFYCDFDGSFHFHSSDFGVNKDGFNFEIAASYIFAGDARGEVISFEPTDNQTAVWLMGGGNSVYEGIDSVQGSKLEDQSTALGGPAGARPVGVSDAHHTTSPGNKTTSKQQIIARDPETLRAMMQHRWTSLTTYAYGADLVVRGTHAVRPFDYVSVRYVKKNGKDHYLSGVFKVQGVKHSFGVSGWETTIKLMREGTKETPDSVRRDTKENRVIGEGAQTQNSATAVTSAASGAATSSTTAIPVNPGGEARGKRGRP